MLAAGHDAGSPTDQVISGYLEARRAAGYRARSGGRALVPLLGYLRGLGVVPKVDATPATPAEALLAEFSSYLAGERGLAAVTVRRYLRFARVLFAGLGITGEADLAAVTAVDIAAFTVGQASRRNPADMQGLVTAVRSLLGFLHVTGRVTARLDAAVPSAPGRRAASLPRGIAPGQTAALLASCDRDSAAGRGDYAILTLLIRMGLRAGEVTRLTLDDIDWRAGELTVRGKGDDHARLPLPADVGGARSPADLRFGRARTADRHLFVTGRGPAVHRAGAQHQRLRDRPPGMSARRDRAVRAAPAPPRGRVRPAGGRRLPGGDRAASASPQPAGYRDLCESGHRGAAGAGPSVPGRRIRDGRAVTGTLRQAAARYLQTRRSLGYQLQAHGRLLNSYIADLEASGQTTVTAANAVAWATRPACTSPVWHARPLSVARCFARYLSATDPSCQVPPAWLLPARYSRVAPYIYTQQQINALVHAAWTPGSPLPAASSQAIISLLAATGMRIGEAIALTRAGTRTWTAGSSPSSTASTAPAGTSRCTPPSRACSGATRSAETGSARCRDPTGSSSPRRERRCRRGSCKTRSPGCWSTPASAFPQASGLRVFMTSSTLSPWRPSGTGTAMAETSRPGCRSCPPCSGTSPPPMRNHRPARMSDDNVARFIGQHAATAKNQMPRRPGSGPPLICCATHGPCISTRPACPWPC